MQDTSSSRRQAAASERREVLQGYEARVETPLLLLGVAWLLLLIAQLIYPSSHLFTVLGSVIWVVFILDFVLRFSLTPDKLQYLRSQWLLGLSLLLPAFRIFRLAHLLRLVQAARLAPEMNLVSAVASLNKSMSALSATLRRRGFAYVVVLTLVVTFAGAAGMYLLERSPGELGFESYGDALWFTAMIIVTLGSNYWPVTTGGRVLCVVLALYAFTFFGYLTATLASHFIGHDAQSQGAGAAGSQEVAALRAELAALRSERPEAPRPPEP